MQALTAAYAITALSAKYAAAAAAVISAPAALLTELRHQRDEARRAYLRALYASRDAVR